MRIQNSLIGKNLEAAVGAAASAGLQHLQKSVQHYSHDKSLTPGGQGTAAKGFIGPDLGGIYDKVGKVHDKINNEYNRVRKGINDELEKFKKLMPDEQKFVMRHPLVAKDFQQDAETARKAAENRYPPNELHNGKGDAFRHAYWNALMTKRHGADYAKQFADAHETNPNQPADEKEMDLHNNEVGRRIAMENPNATDEELANLIMQAVERGELKTLK